MYVDQESIQCMWVDETRNETTKNRVKVEQDETRRNEAKQDRGFDYTINQNKTHRPSLVSHSGSVHFVYRSQRVCIAVRASVVVVVVVGAGGGV